MSNNQRRLLWAVLSVVLTTLLWLYVMVIENPDSTQTIRNVPVSYTGEEILAAKNLEIIENITGTVEFTFNGRLTDLNKLDNKNVRAMVDVSGISQPGIVTRVYEPDFPDNLKGTSLSAIASNPRYVQLLVDSIITKVIEVRLVPNIEPAEGYITGQYALEHREVRIVGPSTILDLIEYAEITLNRNDVSLPIDTLQPFKYKDFEGNEIPGDNIDSEYQEIRVYVPILKLKEVRLDVRFLDGGGITSEDNIYYEIDPPSIVLSGEASVMDGVNTITLQTIDLSKLENSGSIEFPIPLPNDCTNLSGETTAVVKIDIVGAQILKLRTPYIEIVNEDLPEGYTIRTTMNEAEVIIRGPENIVVSVEPHNIRVVIDLTNQTLSPGHSLYPAAVYIDGFPRVGAVGDLNVAVEVVPIDMERDMQ